VASYKNRLQRLAAEPSEAQNLTNAL